MTGSDGNGQKVTVAVLGNKMDTLTATVSKAMNGAEEDRRAIVALATRVTRIEERMGIWAAVQAAYATVAAALAGFLGSR